MESLEIEQIKEKIDRQYKELTNWKKELKGKFLDKNIQKIDLYLIRKEWLEMYEDKIFKIKKKKY